VVAVVVVREAGAVVVRVVIAHQQALAVAALRLKLL
jgi:hypothetical protein